MREPKEPRNVWESILDRRERKKGTWLSKGKKRKELSLFFYLFEKGGMISLLLLRLGQKALGERMIRRYRGKRHHESLFGHVLAIGWFRPHRRNVSVYEQQSRINFWFDYLPHILLLYFIMDHLAIDPHFLFSST